MKKPQYEEPIDTVKDLVEQNRTLFREEYYFSSLKKAFLEQNTSEFTHIAKYMIPTNETCGDVITCLKTNDSWAFYVKHHVHGNRTHAFFKSYLFNYDLGIIPSKKDWYRSKESLSVSNPFTTRLTSSKWILNEVF